MLRLSARFDLPVLVLALLVAGPTMAGLVGTILPAFGYLPPLGGTSFSWSPIGLLLAQPGLSTSVLLSFFTGLGATLVSLTLVLLFAAGWHNSRSFRAATRLLSPLLSVPHAAAAIGLAFLIAPSGFLVRLFSPWVTGWTQPPDLLILNDHYGLAMTAGLIGKEFPFLFLMLLVALPQTDFVRLSKVASSLGYGQVRGFLMVVLPRAYPQVRLPALAVVAYSTSAVDVALILGPTTPAPLAPRILAWAGEPDASMRLMASAGSLLQLAVSAAALLTYLAAERIAFELLRLASETGRRCRRSPVTRYGTAIAVWIIVGSMMLSLSIIALWALSRSWWFPTPLPIGLALDRLLEAAIMGETKMLSTLSLGLPVAVLSIIVAIWLLETRASRTAQVTPGIKALVFLPLLLPQVSFLFGLHILFLFAGIPSGWLAVAFAHAIFVFPYAFLALADPWRHLDSRIGHVAASLGASSARIFWQVRLPLMLRPVLTATAIAFAVSVGQYLPTTMIGGGRIETVTSEAVALASGGNRHLTALYALFQLVLPLGAFIVAAAIPAALFHNRAGMRHTRG